MDDGIQTLETIKKEFSALKNVNLLHKNGLSFSDKLALFITQKIGTMGFFFIIFIWTIGWLGWNMYGPEKLRFDPYPGFVLWLFISNLIQIHLMPLIMVGQNLQDRHAQLRTEHDFETNRKAEKEIETIILRLEAQDKMMRQILDKLKK
jgi:uncharacterized membrane protein